MTVYDLKDVTFTIPVRYDTDDRVENLRFIIDFLRTHFDTNIIVMEEASEKRFDWVDAEYVFIETHDPNLHRTKCLNDMAKMAKTPYVSNYDTDVFFPVRQYLKTMELLREGKADMVFPYGGRFLDIPRKYINTLRENDFAPKHVDVKECHLNHPSSLGGAIFWDKEKFFKMGLENQNFKSWGWEDNERYIRAQKFSYSIKRVDGPLYHINHKRLADSTPKNIYYKNNEQEFNRVQSMTPANLKKYVQTWEWVSDASK